MRRPALFLVVLVALLQSATAALAGGLIQPSFRIPDQFPAGVIPMVNAIADLNGDGDNDVVVTDPAFDGGVNVLLGDGSGQLGAPINTPLPSNGTSFDVAVDDVDLDGVPDLVVYSIGGATVRVVVLLGAGDGTFTQGQEITSPGAGEVTLADFDLDGAPDIAYSHGSINGDVIRVVLNEGDGTFGPPDSYAPPFFLGLDGLTTADVDVDGDPDLVFLGGCPKARLNQGDGTFGPEVCSPDPQGRLGGIAVAVGDYDEDGIPDIATGDASGGHVAIGLGVGDGHFTFFKRYSGLANQVNWVIAADFTGDATLDIIAGSSEGFATLMQGKGDGTFQKLVRWITGGSWISAGQLGGSPLPDVVSAGGLEMNKVGVSLNLGRGTFHAPRMFPATGTGTGIRTGDLNGDGKDDVAFVVGSSSIEAHLAGRNATFGKAKVSPIVPGETRSFRLADLNEDGHLDVVGALTTTPNIFVALGDGDGTFGPASRFTNGGGTAIPSGLAVADVDDDGHLDLVSATPSQLSVLPGTGTGSLGAPILSGMGGGSSQAATLLADFDGDGTLDAASAEVTGSQDFAGMALRVNLGNGDGTFSFAYSRSADTNVSAGATQDLNGDGRPEVVISGSKGSNSGRTGMYVFLNSAGTLQPPVYYPSQSSFLQLVDINGDGPLDVVTKAGIGSAIGINLGNGDATFAPQTLIPLAADSGSMDDGDVTGDGRPDLVVLYGSVSRSSFAPYVNETP